MMRIIAAVVIALTVVAGLGFQTLHISNRIPQVERDATTSILAMHRNHPGLKRIPGTDVPTP